MTRILLAGSALPVLAVVGPESASWVLLILGVGAIGALLRRRRAAIALATCATPAVARSDRHGGDLAQGSLEGVRRLAA